jgi:uncharacterized membrane protein YhhN
LNIDPLIVLTISSVVVLIVADKRGARSIAGMAKVIASLSFLAFALARDVFASAPGSIFFVGLVLSFVGDVALLSKEKRPFLVGLSAFLLAHVAYSIAIASREIDMRMLPYSATMLTVVGAVVLRWLWPHVKSSMRAPVVLYVVAICVMVALAGALLGPQASTVANGAILFLISDVFVARERFVKPGGINRVVGLPLYYAGQIALILGMSPRV